MQTIYIDISHKGVIPTLYTKQGDIGRKFLAVFTDGGLPYNIPNGAMFSVWYKGDSGEGNYTDIGEKSAFSVTENRVEVELISQMFGTPGSGFVCLVLTKNGGGQIGSWNIPYTCEEVPGFGSDVATEYYTAFSQALEKLQDVSKDFTPEAIGAAPAGYGLGEVQGKWVATPDDISESGFYRSVAPSVSTGNAWYLCISYTEQYKTVFGFKEDTGGLAFMRTMKAGVWGEWEWVNPPMLPGVEYRTTERWNGKPVYTKLVDCGAAAHGKRITIGNAQVIRHSGVLGDEDVESYVLPDMYYDSDMLGAWVSVYNEISDYEDYDASIQIHNDTYGSGYNIIVQVWYIKEDIF